MSDDEDSESYCRFLSSFLSAAAAGSPSVSDSLDSTKPSISGSFFFYNKSEKKYALISPDQMFFFLTFLIPTRYIIIYEKPYEQQFYFLAALYSWRL